MKNSFILSSIILLSTMTAWAQLSVESTTKESEGGQTIFHVDIPQTTYKSTEQAWFKYIGKGSKGKSSTDGGHFMQLGAVNKNISSEPFDVHSTITEGVAGVRLSAWFTKNGKPLQAKETEDGQNLALRKYMYDFATEEYRCAVKEELDMEINKLKTMEKTMASIIKDGERSGKTVSRNERSGQRTTDAMLTSENDIEIKSGKIEDQRDMVDATETDPNATKGANKTMDELKDEKKDLQKLNESQGRDLDDLNKDTRAAERNMLSSNQQMTDMQTKIDAQRLVVNNLQVKLDAIK